MSISKSFSCPMFALFVVLSGLATAFPATAGDRADREEEAKYLLICAGDQARTAPDFLAVINFDEDSPEYGKPVATVNFPAPDAVGNEPHHIGLSADGATVACGGLLSVLRGQ